MLEINQSVPALDLYFDDGTVKNLNDFKGQKLILFFYPKDSTPGCTKEACSISQNFEQLQQLGYLPIGISPQDAKSKAKFRTKYNLTMPLVCDENTALCEAFGVWQEKKLYGRTFMGVVRSTFIIDENGIITHVFKKVKPANHGEELVELLK